VLDMGNGVSATLHIDGLRNGSAVPAQVPMFVELPAECIAELEEQNV
jgi:hypothetical protein